MTEAEWLSDEKGLGPFLRELVGTGTGMPTSFKSSVRKEWLFAVACSRSGLVQDERLHKALGIVERCADGLAGDNEVRKAWEDADGMPSGPQRDLALALLGLGDSRHVGSVTYHAERLEMAHLPGDPLRNINLPAHWKIWRGEIALLRDIFGNPFRPSPPLPPAVLAWNDGTVRRIAEAIYEERKMPEGTLDYSRLAILADALLDAGCDNEDLIAHCREPGPHVRGCWAVDLILGKS